MTLTRKEVLRCGCLRYRRGPDVEVVFCHFHRHVVKRMEEDEYERFALTLVTKQEDSECQETPERETSYALPLAILALLLTVAVILL